MAVATSALIAGGIAAAGSAASAAAQHKAAKVANRTIRETAKESKGYLAPWREAGERSLAEWEKRAMAGPGEFEASPGYEFRKAEGEKTLRRAAAARGELWSGGHEKELINYNQDVASDEYDRFFSRFYQSLEPLQQMAGLGYGAAANTAGISEREGVRVAEGEYKKGDAISSGISGVANSIRSGISDMTTLREAARTPDFGGGGGGNFAIPENLRTLNPDMSKISIVQG